MKKGNSHIVAKGIAVGIAAAAAAGAYFLYGKDGGKNRKKVKSWMLKAKADVMDEMARFERGGKAEYHKAIEGALKKYRSLKHISAEDLSAFGKEMKKEWRHIERVVKTAGGKKLRT